MPSWQEYIDTNLVGSGYIDKAVICDTEQGIIWGISPGFNVSPEEIASVTAFFKSGGSRETVKDMFNSGFSIAGEQCNVTHADADKLEGQQAKGGVIIGKSDTIILVCHYPEAKMTGNAVAVVGKLADYLRVNSY